MTVSELELVVNNLKSRNEELMDYLQELENPERTLLVVSHNEDKENKWCDILQMFYKAAFENRLAFSEVKDQEGNVHMALCAIFDTNEQAEISLFPMFTVTECKTDEKWLFPAPGGDWVGTDETVEAPIALK
jgi:hypothetical protein